MAFAVTKFNAYGRLNTNATPKRGIQIVELTITGANTDIAYDLGTTAGTFWVSAEAHATYGAIATAAKTFILTTLYGQVASIYSVSAQALCTPVGRINAATASSNTYTQAVAVVTTPMIELAFASGSAPTTGTYIFEWLLADNTEPLTASYG